MRAVRVVLAVSALAVGLLAVSFMQKKFDDGDLKRAIGAVRSRFPGEDCRAEIRSRVRGLAEVTCGERRFTVDVVRGAVIEDGGPSH